MTENEPDILDTTGTPVGTTGRQLRAAREANGWDVNSLSESLHLRPAVLMAIENGDYREVPELFLKGYVRSYARLVGLNGDVLIRQLESELQPIRDEEAERRVESPIFHIEVKKRKKRRIAFWILLLAFLGVIVFGVIRFQGMGYGLGPGTEAPAQMEQPVEADSEVAEDAFLGTPDPDRATPDAGTPDTIELIGDNGDQDAQAPEVLPEAIESEEPGAEPEMVQAPVEQAQVDTQASADSDPNTAGPTDSPSEDSPRETASDDGPEPSGAALDGSGINAEEPVAVAEPITESTTTAEPPAQADTANLVSFSIAFDDDCWIEVRNASGERVFAALQAAGDQLTQSVHAPVSFVIGNIGGIETFVFDGESVDIDGYPSRNGRAQITLGANSDN